MMDIGAPIDSQLNRNNAGPAGLAQFLRARTRKLHVAAERSGIIRELLRGGGTREGYTLLLSNLLPAYRELECGLDRHVDSRGVRHLVRPELYRTARLERDLAALLGPRWSQIAVVLPEGERYAMTVARAAEDDGARLIAHAYLRYLGDLSGGQIMKGILAKSLGLTDGALAYYEFPDIADVTAFKEEFRNWIDRAAAEIGGSAPIIEEAIAAFRLNIALSEAVYAIAQG